MATRSRTTASPRSVIPAAEAQLRAHALTKPEATEHFPWGERAIKVKGKVFLFMFADTTHLSLSTKLPDSGQVALLLPFAKPTGYGLGKAGWVSASFDAGQVPPIDMLCAWIDESYQAVAPAKLAALARGDAPAPDDESPQAAPAEAVARKPAAARKPMPKPKATAAPTPAAARKPRSAAARKPAPKLKTAAARKPAPTPTPAAARKPAPRPKPAAPRASRR